MGSVTLPPFHKLAKYEGLGRYAIRKYYAFPYRFFYRKKLKMIVDLMPKDHIYNNILDYGSGPGIFTPELKRHAINVKSFDMKDVIDPRWRFQAIVCASVLEFTDIYSRLYFFNRIMSSKAHLYIASPMNTRLSRAYFKLIGDKESRHSHKKILSEVSKQFKIEEYHTWMKLYFSIKATKLT